MVTTIVFWNTLHLSNRTDEIERHCARQLDSGQSGAQRRNARRKRMEGGPITRGKYSAFKARKSSKSKGPKGIQKSPHHAKPRRAERAEMRDMEANERAEKLAKQYKNKLAYAKGLPRQNDHVFYSEVMPSYPHWQNPLAPGAAHTANTLGYYYAAKNVGTPLPLSPITSADVSKPISRYPKGVVIGGVRFIFWHAVAKSSYADVVAEAYQALEVLYNPAPFVLFGDLNAPPHKVVGHGVAVGNILNCGFATHHRGKELDYAITNAPHLFVGPKCSKYNSFEPSTFKKETGSDHVPMILRMK